MTGLRRPHSRGHWRILRDRALKAVAISSASVLDRLGLATSEEDRVPSEFDVEPEVFHARVHAAAANPAEQLAQAVAV